MDGVRNKMVRPSSKPAMSDGIQPSGRIAAVIATADRPCSLAECLRSLARSRHRVARVIVVDASSDREASRQAVIPGKGTWPFLVEFIESPERGAAAQRQRGLSRVEEDMVLFLDDDVVVDPDCVAELRRGFDAMEGRVAGVAANLVNQPVPRPGLATRATLFVMGGGLGPSYAGRLIGPAVGMRPDDGVTDRFIEMEWACTACVLYRREAVRGGFRSFFTGYSLGEDVALSVDARRHGAVLYARDAGAVHSPRQSLHPSARAYGRMEILNRWFLTARVLGRDGVVGRVRFGLWIAWEWLGGLRRVCREPRAWGENWAGRWEAMGALWRGGWDE